MGECLDTTVNHLLRIGVTNASMKHATRLCKGPRSSAFARSSRSSGRLHVRLNVTRVYKPKRNAHCYYPLASPTATSSTRRKSVRTRRITQEKRTMVSRRACDAPLPEGVSETTTSADGCNVCTNKGRYGRGTSVCRQCGRCHGCGSSNNGIGPLQATYFGLRNVVRKVDGQLRGGDDKEQQKDDKTVGGSAASA